MGIYNNVLAISWPWVIAIGLVAECSIVTLGWAVLATAKGADKNIERYARERKRAARAKQKTR